MQKDDDLVVWLNANVPSVTGKSTFRIEAVKAMSPSGNQLNVYAKIVVICAGALETTRLLLAYNEASNDMITEEGAPLGEYFSDHLSVTAGKIIWRNTKRLAQTIMPIFDHGIMRTPRLELSPSVQGAERLPSAFAHFTFNTSSRSGLDIVRDLLLRKRQRGSLRDVSLSSVPIFRIAKDITSLIYQRFLQQRLWLPNDADLSFQVDIEQTPRVGNRLFLVERRDQFNRKKLAIEWNIGPQDIRAIDKMCELLNKAWKRSKLGVHAELLLRLQSEFDTHQSLYDVYHPTGSVRMGSSPSNSVVNSDLRLWVVENCFISSTAVFPSAGSGNPGLTHLALTTRLAEYIAKI